LSFNNWQDWLDSISSRVSISLQKKSAGGCVEAVRIPTNSQESGVTPGAAQRLCFYRSGWSQEGTGCFNSNGRLFAKTAT